MMRSAKALDVPGTVLIAASISRASFSITFRSWPMTLTPTGVRMPVASMSMRALIGIVQAFETPGNCSALSISLDQLVDGHARAAIRSRGFRLMMVSNISVGAGIGRGRRAAGLAEHALDLGEGLDDLVLDLQQLGRLGDREARQRRRHVDQRALVQARHELGAEPASPARRCARGPRARRQWSAPWPCSTPRMIGR